MDNNKGSDIPDVGQKWSENKEQGHDGPMNEDTGQTRAETAHRIFTELDTRMSSFRWTEFWKR